MPEEAWFLTQSEFVYFLMSVLVFHNQSCAPCFFLYGAPVPLLAQNGSFYLTIWQPFLMSIWIVPCLLYATQI